VDGRAQAELIERPGLQLEPPGPGCQPAQVCCSRTRGRRRGRVARTQCVPSAEKAKPVAKPAVKHIVSAQQRQSVIENGLNRHKVLAILFFNPAAADDQAVKHELGEVPVRGGKVVKLAVPLSELTRYPLITNQVQVTESPMLVLIHGQRKADMLTGYLDQFELAQRVSAALAVK
jgi:hypothetical protein